MNQQIIIKIIYLTVLLTGLFSLVYQSIWQRYLTFIVGSDSGASTLILTLFLSVLSIGYWVSGYKSKNIKGREIYYYRLVEVLIGAWALLFPWLFKASFTLLSLDFGHLLLNDLLISLLLIAPPAILMGVTLPFLTQGLSYNFKTASKTNARVYAINTIGACFGALLAGFLLLENLGLSFTSYLLGGINILFGFLMLYLSKITQIHNPAKETGAVKPVLDNSKQAVNKTFVLFVAACSGYLLIALESYFIRLFSIITDGSNHAYPTVVGAFIAAVGLGAGLAQYFGIMSSRTKFNFSF